MWRVLEGGSGKGTDIRYGEDGDRRSTEGQAWLRLIGGYTKGSCRGVTRLGSGGGKKGRSGKSSGPTRFHMARHCDVIRLLQVAVHIFTPLICSEICFFSLSSALQPFSKFSPISFDGYGESMQQPVSLLSFQHAYTVPVYLPCCPATVPFYHSSISIICCTCTCTCTATCTRRRIPWCGARQCSLVYGRSACHFRLHRSCFRTLGYSAK